MILPVVLVTIMFLGTFAWLHVTLYFDEQDSIQQERELEALVDEIQDDIDDGNFDEAYIKAQSIIYTENWSHEIEDKWENTRKEVIKQIIEAEKEATGSSSHAPETDGLFDGWFD